MPSTRSASQFLFEGADAPATDKTPYAISAGQTFSGNLATGDRDWVAITLAAGERVEVRVTGDSLDDPYLRVRGHDGAEIRANDDSADSDSRLLFGSAEGGTFYLSVGSYDDDGAGSYRLAVSPHVPRTYDWHQIADYLKDGYWAAEGDDVGRTFDLTASNGVITYDVGGLAATTAQGRMGRQHVDWALEAWSSVTGIRFVKTGAATAQLRFDDEGDGANSSTTFHDGHIVQSRVNIGASFLPSDNVARVDGYLMQTYLHEIGHALGLGHAGPYDGRGDFDIDVEYLNDSWQASVMSYISQSENTSVAASRAYVAGPQIADILAVQNIYGTPVDTRTGDTVYGHNSTAGGYLDKLGATAATWTIFDSGGTDTIDYSRDARAQTYDLRDGFFSSVMGERGNIGIAVGTIIENVRAGSGHDRISGNTADNRLDGNAGNDTIRGNSGDDSILGGAGNDMLSGGYGDDFMGGGEGNDRVSGDFGNDRLFGGFGNDTLLGGNGNDDLSGSFGSDTLMGDGGRDVLRGGNWGDFMGGGGGNDTVLGDGGHDRIYGGYGNDLLDGSYGNDRLYGGPGADRLYGGWGTDTFVFSAVSDSTGGAKDRIFAFGGGDRIDLRGIDADLTVAGNQAFSFVGRAAYGGAGDLRFGTDGTDGYLMGDVNGDGVHDLVITLVGTTALPADVLLL